MKKLYTERVTLPDISLAIRQWGTGEKLLMLHGNSGSKKMYEKYQLRHFSSFHTIAVDSRGHGESESACTCFSINQFSDDIIRLCIALNIEQANVIGYSDGGNIALLLAHKNPERFRKLIAISPNYLASGVKENWFRFVQVLIKTLSCLRHWGIKLDKQIMKLHLMLQDIGIADRELVNTKAEVKIIYAQNDFIKPEHMQKIASLIPRASICMISGCNHLNIVHKREAIQEMQLFFG